MPARGLSSSGAAIGSAAAGAVGGGFAGADALDEVGAGDVAATMVLLVAVPAAGPVAACTGCTLFSLVIDWAGGDGTAAGAVAEAAVTARGDWLSGCPLDADVAVAVPGADAAAGGGVCICAAAGLSGAAAIVGVVAVEPASAAAVSTGPADGLAPLPAPGDGVGDACCVVAAGRFFCAGVSLPTVSAVRMRVAVTSLLADSIASSPACGDCAVLAGEAAPDVAACAGAMIGAGVWEWVPAASGVARGAACGAVVIVRGTADVASAAAGFAGGAPCGTASGRKSRSGAPAFTALLATALAAVPFLAVGAILLVVAAFGTSATAGVGLRGAAGNLPAAWTEAVAAGSGTG